MLENILKIFGKQAPKQKLQPQVFDLYSKRDPQTHKLDQIIVRYTGQTNQQYSQWKRMKYRSYNPKKLLERVQASSFVDHEFPHANASISQQQSQMNFQWRRIPDVINYAIYSSAETFHNFQRISISNKKLKQALLFMYRTHPSKFKELLARDCNSTGMYQYRLYKRGVIENIIIDDYIPVVNGVYPLMVGPIAEREVFPMLIEKAIAKACGGYDKIPEDLDELLEIIFCGPLRKTKIDELANREAVSSTVQNTLINNGVAGFISKKQPKLRSFGISQNEIYHILNKSTAQIKNQSEIDLYELVSQKKLASWNGKFSHNDAEWDKIQSSQRVELFKRLKQNKSFFISGNDVPRIFDHLVAFDGTDILNKDWVELESQIFYPSFTVFQLEQNDRIFIRISTPQPVRTSLILAKQIGIGKYRYIKGSFHQSTYSLQICQQLKPGSYIICVHHDWILNKSGKYSIFLSSDCHTILKMGRQSDYPNFLQTLFKGMNQEAKKTDPLPDFLTVKRFYSIGMMAKQNGFAFIDFSLKDTKQKQVFIQILPKVLAQQSWQIIQPNAGRTAINLQKGKQEELLLILKTHKYVSQQIVQFPSTAFKVKA